MFTWKSLNSLCMVGILMCAGTAFSADPSLIRSASSEAANTTITSQRMTVHNQENKAVFEGTVILTKGVLVVHSDLMVVFFKPAQPPEPSSQSSAKNNGQVKDLVSPAKSKNGAAGNLPVMGNRSISLIEATGKVKIVKEDGQATCRKAVYHGDEEKIVLTGDPVAWQKGTRVTGQKIIMYLAEDRSVVEGGSKVMIAPDGGAAP